MKNPKENPKNGKNYSFFESIRFSQLRWILRRIQEIYHVWYLTIYEPKLFFEFTFGKTRRIALEKRIFFELFNIYIDSKDNSILNTAQYLAKVGGITIASMVLSFDIVKTGLQNISGSRNKFSFIELSGITLIDEIMGSIFLVVIIICFTFLTSYIFYQFLDKSKITFRELADFFTYTICSWTLTSALLVPLPAIIYEHVSVGRGTLLGQILNSYILMYLFIIYSACFTYVFVIVNMKLSIAAPIIVLQEIFKIPVHQIIFTYIGFFLTFALLVGFSLQFWKY